MEHVNDDMDELFRKAGELYPLKTSEPDWDGMLGKLREEISGETGIPHTIPTRNNSTRRRWLMLMLIPAFIFSLVYFTRSRVDEKNIPSVAKTKDLSVNKNNPVTQRMSRRSGQTDKKPATGSESPIKASNDATATTQVSATKSKTDGHVSMKADQALSSQSNISKVAAATGKTTRDAALFQSASLQTKNGSGPETFREPVQKPLFLTVYGLNENPSVYGTPFPPSVQKDITPNSKTAGAAKTNTNKAGSAKGIYAVLMGGPDWSSVKLQSTEQAGYSLGILMGYRFNKRLSLETGLLWDKKNYYSDGKYFDKSKTSIPDTLNIENLDGYCNMFEIPINLQYSFANRNNHRFFVEAGLSSYLMKKEYYNYEVSVNYSGTWGKNSTYLNSSKNFFSILQISGGYEYSIGKNTNIRIEPYVKIPLGGIGIGNMPISSMGLYFGISHLFH